MRRLVVIGQGYVGLPMALRAAAKGFSVIGLDNQASLVEALNAGRSHIDDVSDDELKLGLAAGYAASTDASCVADADVVVVCVPTPLSADGGPDLGAIEGAARTIGKHIQPQTLVILESTSYPGTTEEVFAPLVLGSNLQLGKDVNIAFSPERIDPGNPTYGVQNTPKVVGGLTPACTTAARDFYAQFIDTVVEAKGAKEAEMATSRWSTRWCGSATSWTSTSGMPSTAPRPSRSVSWPSDRVRASAATASLWIRHI